MKFNLKIFTIVLVSYFVFLTGLNIAVVADGGKVMPYALMWVLTTIGLLFASLIGAINGK